MTGSAVLIPIGLLLFFLAAYHWRHDPRRIQAAYLFVVIFLTLLIALGAVGGLATAIANAIVDPGGGCPQVSPASARIEAQASAPPTAPPAATVPPAATAPPVTFPPITFPPITFPPEPTQPPVETFEVPLPTIEIPDNVFPSPFPFPSSIPYSGGGSPFQNLCGAGGRDAAPAQAAKSVITLVVAGAVLLFHADRARKLVQEEG